MTPDLWMTSAREPDLAPPMRLRGRLETHWRGNVAGLGLLAAR
jgi:hypothetical protein